MYYDKDGTEIEDTIVWAKKFEDKNYKRVALDSVGDWRVSTVWMGLNHNFVGFGRPLIFETMAWREKTGEFEPDQERYSTLAEAQAGHKRWVARYKRRKAQDVSN